MNTVCATSRFQTYIHECAEYFLQDAGNAEEHGPEPQETVSRAQKELFLVRLMHSKASPQHQRKK
jgi:hypothetical protein